jgi:hypothetical protein
METLAYLVQDFLLVERCVHDGLNLLHLLCRKPAQRHSQVVGDGPLGGHDIGVLKLLERIGIGKRCGGNSPFWNELGDLRMPAQSSLGDVKPGRQLLDAIRLFLCCRFLKGPVVIERNRSAIRQIRPEALIAVFDIELVVKQSPP